MGAALKRRIKQDQFESSVQEALLNLMIVSDHLRARLGRVCAAHALTLGQYNVLRILKGVYPDGHPRCEIAVRLLERAPDVTRLVNRLEAQGLVARDKGETDRRHSITRVTRKGLRVLDRVTPELETEVEQIFIRKISVRDSVVLSRICERIYDEDDS